jgi:hypothetical protein
MHILIIETERTDCLLRLSRPQVLSLSEEMSDRVRDVVTAVRRQAISLSLSKNLCI